MGWERRTDIAKGSEWAHGQVEWYLVGWGGVI